MSLRELQSMQKGNWKEEYGKEFRIMSEDGRRMSQKLNYYKSNDSRPC